MVLLYLCFEGPGGQKVFVTICCTWQQRAWEKCEVYPFQFGQPINSSG